MFKEGELFRFIIEGLTAEAEGIGSIDGFKVFVPGALPGETVLVVLTELKKRYGRAQLVEVITSSPKRQNPPCPVYGRCGGCQLQHLSYLGQLDAKADRVAQAFRRIGHLDDVDIKPCIPSPQHFSYRNKIQLPVALSGDHLTIGLYQKNSHQIIPIDRCLIHSELGEEVFQVMKKLTSNSKISPYDEKSGRGELRHCMIKTAVYSGEVLVTLVTNGEGSQELKELAKEIYDSCSSIKGVVQNLNHFRSNTILGKEYRTLCGGPSIKETICGMTFNVSSASFFQVNPLQAEHLYRYAVAAAKMEGSETVVDAYCGVGTLSLLLAQRAKKVIGIECIPEAIEDAKFNASANNVTNVHFYCEQTERALRFFKGCEIVVLNPPRKGCDPSVIRTLTEVKPKRIVYVSCDPATIARDVALLHAGGYQIDSIQPFDMFPQTAHVETVATLCIRSP